MAVSGNDFLKKQMEYLAKKDIDGLMKAHYHPDAEMITFEFILKGTEEIKKYLKEDNPAKAGEVLASEMTHFAASDDTIIFTAAVKTEKLGTFMARDALYLKDGKILRQISLTVPPDQDMKLLNKINNNLINQEALVR